MYNKVNAVGFIILLVGALGVVITVALHNLARSLSESAQQVRITNIPQHSIVFVENQGQWDSRIAYVARKQSMTAWLQKDRVTYRFARWDSNAKVKGIVMSTAFEGASEQVTLNGEQEQTTNHNFFIGNDQSKWQSNVAGYAKVIYHEIYNGIDLCFREENGWLEYDLLLHPGADLSDVVIYCEGLKSLCIDENGILIMETEFGPITQQPPVAWYEALNGESISVACDFRLIDDKRYGFEVETDLGLALVIDPGIEWSTFLGGSDDDRAISLDLTPSLDIIIAGVTESVDFPGSYGAYDTTFAGGPNDGFISCISADGTQLLWSTFLGGNSTDVLFEVALDETGRVIVAGLTNSPDFPTTPGVYDTTYNGALDGIISCLSSNGSQLLYSTYLGTSSEDMILALDVSNSGEAIVGGYTSSINFPVTSGAYDTTYNGAIDAYVTRISADGTVLVYSTYLGGSDDDGTTYQYPTVENSDAMIIVLDDADNVIVGGATFSSDFPTTPGAYDTTYNDSADIFITKINATGSDLIFSTYLGGSSLDAPWSEAMDLGENGTICIGGITSSPDFPVTYNAFDTTFNAGYGDWDAFVTMLDSTGNQLTYSTFIGGTSPGSGDAILSLVFDIDGNILFVGQAEDGFPTTPGAYDTIFGGGLDAFLARLSPQGNGQADLIYSSFIGGSNYEAVDDLTIINDSTAVMVGRTNSHDFPTTMSSYDPSYNGGMDGFILRFGAYIGIEEQTVTKPLSSISLSEVYPNPVFKSFNYRISVTQANQVKVYIVDVTGRLIEPLIDRQLAAGVHEFEWHPSKELANGIYFLKLETGDYNAAEKLLLIR